jgi:hypothetical protein
VLNCVQNAFETSDDAWSADTDELLDDDEHAATSEMEANAMALKDRRFPMSRS